MEREKGFHGRIRFHSDGPRFDGGERFGYGKGEFLVSEIFVEFYVFGSFAEWIVLVGGTLYFSLALSIWSLGTLYFGLLLINSF